MEYTEYGFRVITDYKEYYSLIWGGGKICTIESEGLPFYIGNYPWYGRVSLAWFYAYLQEHGYRAMEAGELEESKVALEKSTVVNEGGVVVVIMGYTYEEGVLGNANGIKVATYTGKEGWTEKIWSGNETLFGGKGFLFVFSEIPRDWSR